VPAPSESVDLALNMFSPLARQETVRLLRKDGIFIMAIPDTDHLFELKAVIYDTPYKNSPAPFELEGLTFLEAKHVSYKLHLKSKEEILSLFHMTPYAYRTRKEDADRLLSLENLDISTSFVVIIYKKSC
jgi:23S rRNA (guanine745-N1)-methyltransferase